MDANATLDIKPMAHINMLKEKNAEYKIKIRQLEEELAMVKQANIKLSQNCEFAEAKATFNAKEGERVKKLCNQEVTELKHKLFKVEFELSQMKKVREMPQLQRIETNDQTIDIDDSDEEMLAEQDEEEEEEEEVMKEEPTQDFPEQQQTFKCTFCPKTYVHEKRLRNHLQLHVRCESPSSVPITPSQRGSNCTVQYQCKYAGCNFKCLYKPAFNRHEKSHTLPVYKCNVPGCTYSTPYEKRLYNHFNQKHPRQPDDDDDQFSYFNDTEFQGLIQDRLGGLR